nr:hypothetical protein CPAG_02564 [Coccidioides posadasii RMSCC 3488]
MDQVGLKHNAQKAVFPRSRVLSHRAAAWPQMTFRRGSCSQCGTERCDREILPNSFAFAEQRSSRSTTPIMDPRFTVIVRLPFPRGDFVDPPPPDWTTAKDRVLWEVLLQPSKPVDWNALASQLDVTLPFLLQQAAWLYGHRLAQVRAEILRAGHQQPASPAPTPVTTSGSHATGGHALTRGRSSGSPVTSRLSSQQREGQGTPRPDTSTPPTSAKPQVSHSRAPSSTVPPGQIAAVRALSSKPAISHTPQGREPNDKTPMDVKYDLHTQGSAIEPPAGEESPEPMSSSESDSDSSAGPGIPFKRFGKFSLHRPRNTEMDEDEDDEESPAFLPFENVCQRPAPTVENDPGATLRQEPDKSHRTRESLHKEITATASTSTTSSGIGSTSSGYDVQRRHPRLGALSPRRTAELARLSPRHQGKRSDGTPSMGSSFSDLDDASVTQSALEEALLSHMQNGGVASRMSTFSQALRSRYL